MELVKTQNDTDMMERENIRIINMSRIDYGKKIYISKQYIQRNIIKYKLEPFGFRVYSTDLPEINIYNSPSFDLLIIPDGKNMRIVSKCRHLQQIHFETIRINGKKNEINNYIDLSLDEFDYLTFSVVNFPLLNHCILWAFYIIPIDKYISPNIKPHIINSVLQFEVITK